MKSISVANANWKPHLLCHSHLVILIYKSKHCQDSILTSCPLVYSGSYCMCLDVHLSCAKFNFPKISLEIGLMGSFISPFRRNRLYETTSLWHHKGSQYCWQDSDSNCSLSSSKGCFYRRQRIECVVKRCVGDFFWNIIIFSCKDAPLEIKMKNIGDGRASSSNNLVQVDAPHCTWLLCHSGARALTCSDFLLSSSCFIWPDIFFTLSFTLRTKPRSRKQVRERRLFSRHLQHSPLQLRVAFYLPSLQGLDIFLQVSDALLALSFFPH